MTEQELARELEGAGQGHVVSHLRQLEGAEREHLARQLSGFDYGLVRRLAERARSEGPGGEVEEFEPAPVSRAERPAAEVTAARRCGDAEIHAGRVAAFVVAGGQGSRLGFDGPKGCFPIGPVSGKSLFRIHAEKVLATGRRYGAAVPFIVMTSETNDAAVRAFFEEQGWFGLDPADVLFCVQQMLPAFDRDGRFLLDGSDRVFVSPDGHGGSFHALAASGALDALAERGVEHISYFQVDNPLVPAVDPVFLGEHVRAGSEMSSKVVAKREPLEKLGVFGYVDGELRVVEYSEIPKALQKKRLPDGSLKYAFGSIAIHAIDVALARRMAGADLPFHRAEKKIPHVDKRGRRVEPEELNGVKFERFVFDAVPHARNPLVMEVRREDEFAPVKNAEGADSPETARAALAAQHRRWLKQAGVPVPAGACIEISPVFALDANELQGKTSGLHVADGTVLE
jgi:UDP-N-acetylglucosamine/UDP-N-acetylgalactosamine diphosphorylase